MKNYTFTRISPLTNRSFCLQFRFETNEGGDSCHSIEFVSKVKTLNKQNVYLTKFTILLILFLKNVK